MSVSGATVRERRPMPRAACRASISSTSNAHSRWPERTRLAPCSTDASNQACFTISTMSGESAGARALPVFIRSSDAVEVGRQRAPDRPPTCAGSPRTRCRYDRAGRSADARFRRCSECADAVTPAAAFQSATADIVQSSDQWLQLYRAHVVPRFHPRTVFPAERAASPDYPARSVRSDKRIFAAAVARSVRFVTLIALQCRHANSASIGAVFIGACT